MGLQDCSVTITPIFDELCSEPGSTVYSYNDLAIQGAYIDNTHIRTMLPTADSGQYASSYMLTLFADAGKVNATFSAVTVDPALANSISSVVSGRARPGLGARPDGHGNRGCQLVCAEALEPAAPAAPVSNCLHPPLPSWYRPAMASWR